MNVRLIDRIIREIRSLTARELAELNRRLGEDPPDDPPDAGVREPRRPSPLAPAGRR